MLRKIVLFQEFSIEKTAISIVKDFLKSQD